MNESSRPNHDLKDLIERALLEFEEVISRIIERPFVLADRHDPGAGVAVLAIDGSVPSEPA